MSWWHVLQHWLAIHTGTVNESGPWYGFFSGFGSDIGEVTLIGVAIGGFHHLNCASPRCPRLGKHTPDGTTHKMCRKHYKQITGHDVTLEHIHALHHAAAQTERSIPSDGDHTLLK